MRISGRAAPGQRESISDGSITTVRSVPARAREDVSLLSSPRRPISARTLSKLTALLCPACLQAGKTTSTGRAIRLVKDSWCIVCGYKQPRAPTLAEIRHQAVKKSWETRRRNRLLGEELFS